MDYYIYTNYLDKLNKNDIRLLKELSYSLVEKVKVFSSTFYKNAFPVVRIEELKNIIHDAGLNLKFLPQIYKLCPNPEVKKYIYTSMTAKVIKDYFN